MKIDELIHLLNNRLREFKLSRDYARMSGDLERMNIAVVEIIGLEDTIFKLNLLVDTSASSEVTESTLAEAMTDGSVSVLGRYDITPYATDPLHEEKVYNILSKMAVMNTVEKVDKYISSGYRGSPVTGAMVMSGAAAYDIDIRLLMAMMQQDSSFGTAGLAVRTLNPGNVGNDDGGNLRIYASWQEGVTAVAEWLNRHRMAPDGSVVSNGFGFNTNATSTPSYISSTVDATPGMATSTPGMATSTPGMATSTPGYSGAIAGATASTTPGMATSTPAYGGASAGATAGATASTTPGIATSTPAYAGAGAGATASTTPVVVNLTTNTFNTVPETPVATSTPATATSTQSTSIPTLTPGISISTSTPAVATSTPSAPMATSTPVVAIPTPAVATSTPVVAIPTPEAATSTPSTTTSTTYTTTSENPTSFEETPVATSTAPTPVVEPVISVEPTIIEETPVAAPVAASPVVEPIISPEPAIIQETATATAN
ncbi:hypothetical protein COB55_01410 [Candidatus Wolfebacteria bacterium]|nr:MAG: hypothetical protein COB55_01410 [Candidatus Wolfebacteria bacterium]